MSKSSDVKASQRHPKSKTSSIGPAGCNAEGSPCNETIWLLVYKHPSSCMLDGLCRRFFQMYGTRGSRMHLRRSDVFNSMNDPISISLSLSDLICRPSA